jgi:hypothetical protein
VTARLHPSTTPIDRPWYALGAVVLELFTAFGAIPVGIMLITDPTGARVGFPPGWIESTPFGSYLAPGIYLLAMNGVGMLILAGLTLVRHWVAPWLTGVLGTGLAIWIRRSCGDAPVAPRDRSCPRPHRWRSDLPAPSRGARHAPSWRR